MTPADLTNIQDMLRTEFAPGGEFNGRIKAVVQNAINDLLPSLVQVGVSTYMQQAGEQVIREVVAEVVAANK